MSLELLRAVIYYSKARGAAYAVAIGLADHFNDEKGGSWPSVERLATFARTSVRATQYALRELTTPVDEGGLGEWEAIPRPGPKKTTIYRPIFANFGPRVVPSPKGADFSFMGAKSAPNPVKDPKDPVRVQNLHQRNREGTGKPKDAELVDPLKAAAELKELAAQLKRGSKEQS